MGRSQDEKGADKAVAIRRTQQKERARLLADIAEAQKKIATLNEQRAPIAAEVRKVEAEVGPIKYIAALI
jgi:septal ring factor EnvC (AmiA/AmiB activator)